MPESRPSAQQCLLRACRSGLFLRRDFQHLDTYEKVGRAISELCAEKKAIRIGHGLYCRARLSERFNVTLPDVDGYSNMLYRALTRLGYQVVLPRAIDNIEKRSTQVPNGKRVGLRGKQTKRKIGFNGKFVNYENSSSLDTKYNINFDEECKIVFHNA